MTASDRSDDSAVVAGVERIEPVEPAAGSGHPVVVGVDGSAANASAVDWAADEAEQTHRPLLLVTGTGEFAQPRVGVGAEYVVAYDYDQHFNQVLGDLARRLQAERPSLQVEPSVRRGEASACLAELSRAASVTVVGKRGLGAFKRAILGSTSIATVGRTSCPTIVVPDGWIQRTHAGEPLVVGIDLEHDSDPVLAFAFARAHRMSVPVVAVHVWDLPPFSLMPKDEYRLRAADARRAVDSLLRFWRKEYPTVEAVASQANDNPASGLLEASLHTQLLTLGRTSSSTRLTGLPFGSVTRGVLHFSERPVAIVPTLH
jgi:nucleotide-binding universal stress UspA family protein